MRIGRAGAGRGGLKARYDSALNPAWLKATVKADENKQLVVYCEKIWIHRDDLARFEQVTGCKVRPMLVPFNLK